MSFSATDVKVLRERTGAGMMKCKEALSECGGDMEKAIDYLRSKGLAAAAKKQGRVAAEGLVLTLVKNDTGLVVEINCETDFVSNGDEFKNFANGLANHALNNKFKSAEELKDAKAAELSDLTLKIGEKIDVRRLTLLKSSGLIGSYNHGGKIGVLVELKTTKKNDPVVNELVKDLCMHVAAADPKFLTEKDIDEEFKQREAAVYRAQLKEEGKPDNMIDKIVDGKLKKMASEVCLLNQKYIKDPDTTISTLISNISKQVGEQLVVNTFVRVKLGDGIEKQEDNLADEVAKMTGKQ